MPDPDLIRPGFHGKLPATGDFVARGLPPAFTGPWDRWVARHLAPRLVPDGPALHFLRAGPPAAAGVVLASRDAAGRRFPLTLAALVPAADPDLIDTAGDWFAALAATGRRAIAERWSADALAEALQALPCPAAATCGSPHPLVLWTDPAEPLAADPDAPGPALDALVPQPAEAR
jgi:type VI secretion system protein ImpM